MISYLIQSFRGKAFNIWTLTVFYAGPVETVFIILRKSPCISGILKDSIIRFFLFFFFFL